MQDTEPLKILCKQAETEQDAQKLIEIVREINDLLEAKRSNGAKTDSASSTE
jgi:hypothetical protein